MAKNSEKKATLWNVLRFLFVQKKLVHKKILVQFFFGVQNNLGQKALEGDLKIKIGIIPMEVVLIQPSPYLFVDA